MDPTEWNPQLGSTATHAPAPLGRPLPWLANQTPKLGSTCIHFRQHVPIQLPSRSALGNGRTHWLEHYLLAIAKSQLAPMPQCL